MSLQVHHTNEILGLCQNILFINGPFLKEGVYQDLLCHELSILGITISREYVFPYQMNDSRGQRVTIGNGNHFVPILNYLNLAEF